eukprot:gene11761-14373_t
MKHAFICKFNHILSDVYVDYMFVLRSDILNIRKDPVCMDHTYS